MGSSRVARPAAQWYATRVVRACAQKIKSEGGSGEADIAQLLQSYVSSKSMFNRDERNASVQIVLSSFRDVASVLWMMEARDKLSTLLRQKRMETEKSVSNDTSSVQGRKWKSICKEALDSAIHLLPFREMLNVERQIHNIVLSLILEMPSNTRTAETLAEHFPKMEDLDPETQDRLQSILKDWQGDFLSDDASGDGQTGMTMNLIYYEAAANTGRNTQRKRAMFPDYDELVFRNYPESRLEIGSRPFESSVQFAQFLEMFYDVCLGRTVEEAGHVKRRWPLLGEYSSEVRKRELNSLPKKVLSRVTSEIISVEKPFQSQQPVPAKRKLNEVKVLVEVPKMHQRKVGLFRSLSTGDVSRRSEGVITRSSSIVSISSRLSEKESPVELDVLGATPELSRSLRRKTARPSSGNRNNNSSNVKRNAKDIKRATSLVEQTGSHRELEALSTPLVPSWMLERMEFGEGFSELERLTEWLTRWAGQTNAFSDSSVLGVSTLGTKRPSILVRVTPKLLTYSLWLIDNFKEARPKSFEVGENEVTVAMVREVGAGPPSRKNSRTASMKSERGISRETIEEEVSEEWEEEKSSDVEDVIPYTIQQQSESSLTVATPIPRERNKKRGDRDAELDEMTAFNESFRDGKKDGKRKERKGKKKSEEKEEEEVVEDPSDKIFDKDSEQTVISYDIVVSEFESRRFSVEDPQELRVMQQHFTAAENLRTDSESSIAVSSLTGEDLRQTMKDTLISLTGNNAAAAYADELKDDVADGEDRQSPALRSSSAPLQHAVHNEQPLHSDQHSEQPAVVQPDLRLDLQRVIRDEMRRIMAAQQKGILAMLNSLDPSEEALKFSPNGNPPMTNGNPPRMTNTAVPNGNPPRMNGYLPNGNPQRLNQPYNSRPPLIPPQYAVYMMQADVNPMTREKFSSGSTDGSLTPILSDSKLEDWKEEGPLKVSDLKKTYARKDFQNPIVRDALRELGQLRNNSEMRPLLFAPAPYGPLLNHPGLMDRNASASNANRGHPFSGLMEALREMNGKMFPSLRPSVSVNSNLIRLPPPEKQFRFPIQFPNVPLKSADSTEKPLRGNPPNFVVPSPLLQRNYFIREPPDRDTGDATTLPPAATSARPPPFFHGMSALPPSGTMIAPRPAMPVFRSGMPFPLLRLPDMSRMGVRPAFFAPHPGYQTQQPPRSANQFPSDQTERVAPIPDAFPPEATDRSERRRSARSLLNETAEDVRDGSPKVEVAKASAEGEQEEEVDEEPVRLHAGYALTPGMFDEYLAKQDELGSVADTNAKLQYQAAMALQSKPKEEMSVLKKDMYTEINEGELHDSDPVTAAIKKYYDENRMNQQQQQPSGLSLLPPDVFMQLRFAERDAGQMTDASQAANGMRSYLNVVDINSETLADIMSSVRDRQSRQEVALATGSSSVASPAHPPSASPLKESAAVKASSEPVMKNGSGPDAVTFNLFNKKTDPAEISVSAGKLKQSSKTAMDGMDRRMNEIARMAQKMQRDFDDTRLVVTKLEEVGNKVLEEKERRKKTDARSPEHPTECECGEFHGNTTEFQLTNCSTFTADELLERALDTTRHGDEVTRDDLHELFKALSPRQPEEDEKTKEADEKRRSLLEWMEKKRMEQKKKFKNEAEGKRGSEVHPYAPKANQKMLTRNNWEAMDEDRAAKRKKLQLANMELRTQEAAGLLTDLLSDQPNLSKPVIDRPIRTADTTLTRCYPSSAFDTSRTTKVTTRSMGKSKVTQNEYCDYLELLESCEREAEQILKGGNSVEVTARREGKRSPERRPETGCENGKGKAGDKTYQLKSFRDVVKLQRPERTRQSRLAVAKRSSSVEDNRLSTARQREMSLEEKQRIYGSTHIPGSTRQKPTIRTVKSYTQRLQEMKQSPGKENEIHWRYETGSARSQPQSAYGKSELQTTERRQQPSKERHDSKSATFKAPPATGLRWHKPAHPPRTYTEQLQELQRPATVRLEKMRPATSRLVPQQRLLEKSAGHVPRSQRRNRPYADPYSDVDVSSDFSSWSMDENVRKLLYGDRSPLPTASDTELSELMAIRDRESPLDYTDMVNIEDLEMIDGVSINSCLDWEEIDRMVADIN